MKCYSKFSTVLIPMCVILAAAFIIIWMIGYLCNIPPSVFSAFDLWLRKPLSEISIGTLLIAVFFINLITKG